MSTTPGTLRFGQLAASPAAPPVGFCFIYSKTDNVLYLKDSSNVEVALGTASGITALTGEATATGPGSSVITLSNSAVIGKILTGFVSGPNSTVLATDTILQAIQKLQSQISSVAGTSLVGDVTGTLGATVVSTVGTKSASSIAQSVDDTQAATATNTSSTIVKRDASGNFSANEVNADLIGNADTATDASNIGGKSAAQVAQSVDDTQAATSINTASTIVKRDASGNFAANIITANLTGVASGNEPPIAPTTAADYYRGDKTFQPLNKAAVGLSNVDNTSDATKNSAVATLTNKTLTSPVINSPTGLVKADVGLGNVDNTSDVNKPISTATQTALNLKEDLTNKSIDVATDQASNTKYPSVKAVYDWVVANFQAALGYTPANDSLSNLTTTNINQDLLPDSDQSRNLGSTGLNWNQLNVNNISFDGVSGPAIDVKNSQIIDSNTKLSVDYQNRTLNDDSAIESINYKDRILKDTAGDPLVDFSAPTGATTITQAALDNSTKLATTAYVDALPRGTPVSVVVGQGNDAGTGNDLARANHKHDLAAGAPIQIGTSNFIGAATTVALSDHVHAHGNQTSGTLHAIVTNLVNGFMSAVDKVKLDAATALNTVSTLVFRDSSGNFAAGTITASLTGNVSGNLTGNVTGNVSGSADSFTGSLVGDVTGTQGATVVSTVGGKTASAIATSVNDTIAATSVNTVSTIVKRDSNGDIAIRDLTARKITQSGGYYSAVVALTDGATINTDAALGNIFTVTIAGNRTFAAPTNPIADQKITYKIRQDATGARIITWNAIFNFGVDLSGIPNSTSPNIFDYYGFQYNSVTSKWDCLAISRGY
jgi:hypothetical protein